MRFQLVPRNPFARNEVRSSKAEVKLRFQLVRRNRFARNELRSPYEKLAATDWARSKYCFHFFIVLVIITFIIFLNHLFYYLHFFLSCQVSFFLNHFLFHFFNHFFKTFFFKIIFSCFYHFFFQWCKIFKKMENYKCPRFFSFFVIIFLKSFLLPVVELMKHDEK